MFPPGLVGPCLSSEESAEKIRRREIKRKREGGRELERIEGLWGKKRAVAVCAISEGHGCC